MDETTQPSLAEVPAEVAEMLEQRIEQCSFELPLLPEVASRVMSLCASEDTDAAQLSEVLHRDQAFAGHLLRVANSPMMAPTVPIVSLQQAVSRLGMAMVSEIAMGISVQTRVFQATEHLDLLRSLWRHSVATGSFAKEIARVRRRNVESAFLCGLLHDIGKPLVLDAVTEVERDRGKKYGIGALCATMDKFHAKVGALLSREWVLPDQVTEAILYHHDYQSAPRFSEAAMVVNLADHIAHVAVPMAMGLTTKNLDEEAVHHLDVAVDLNLYSDDLDGLMEHSDKVICLVEAMA